MFINAELVLICINFYTYSELPKQSYEFMSVWALGGRFYKKR